MLTLSFFIPNHHNSRPILLNMYTAPAYMMTLLCVVTLFCLVAFFQDRLHMPLHKAKNVRTVKHELIEEVANSRTMCGMLTAHDAALTPNP
jgi:hypothetical protein